MKKSVTEETGRAPKAVRCLGDVEAKVGAKTRCTLVDPDDSEIDLVVRVSDTEGDAYKLYLKVGNNVRAKIKKDELERTLKRFATEQNGQAPQAIRCPDDIKAKVGAKTRCTLVAPDDSEIDVDVRVSDVDFPKGITSKFTYKLAFKAAKEGGASRAHARDVYEAHPRRGPGRGGSHTS